MSERGQSNDEVPADTGRENGSPGDAGPATASGRIRLETGSMTPEELDCMLNVLPLEITFVDANDFVRYFSRPSHMLFTRGKMILGREVKKCHPKRSWDLVDRVLDELRSGKKDEFEFWMTHKERFVHVRYIAVRNPGGEYMGVVETVQDITGIKELEGEKKLL